MPQPNLPVHILLTIILLLPTPQPMLPANLMPRQHLPPQPSNPNLPTLPTPMLDLPHYRHPMPYLLIDLLPIRQPMPFLMPSRVLCCQCPLSELSNLMFYVYECGQLYGMCSWVLLVCGKVCEGMSGELFYYNKPNLHPLPTILSQLFRPKPMLRLQPQLHPIQRHLPLNLPLKPDRIHLPI
jgi:hypothetical protein